MPAMEFWGIEVKTGQPYKINPGDGRVVHLSQAALGEVKKDKGNDNVCVYLKTNDKKLVLGALSPQKFPQLSFDLVLEKDFELSHNWKNGSVYFTGYKVSMVEGTVGNSNGSDSDEDEKEIPFSNNGKPELFAQSISEKPNSTKPDVSTAKQNSKDIKPNQKVDESDSDDSDSKTSSSDDEISNDEGPNRVNAESDESSGELDESDEDDDEDSDQSESDDEDETPKKAEPSRKRPSESSIKTPVPDKKAKFITPQKTESKKGVVHIATPHPSKQAGKTPANSGQVKQQAQKSGGSYPCKSCNRSFTTEGGLQAHTKAKHSAAV